MGECSRLTGAFDWVTPYSPDLTPYLLEMVAYMSDKTYAESMRPPDKPLVWLYGGVRTPPFSPSAWLEAGFLLRKLQRGESLSLPHSRPMPSIGPHCYELRVNDTTDTWRIIYRIDPDAIVIVRCSRTRRPVRLDG
jgi:hypothetical protein